MVHRQADDLVSHLRGNGEVLSCRARKSSVGGEIADEGIEGSVQVRMIVSASGSVESAEVSSSSGYRAMDKAAVQAAYGYSFSPALNVYGEPVRCAVTRTVRFVLR